MSESIIVGCPVKDRAWILPEWYKRVLDATPGYNVDFLFVAEEGDDATQALASAYGEVVMVDNAGYPDNHGWSDKTRIQYMTDLRNILLGKVREKSPDYFFSLDSDILIPKEMFRNLRETLQSDKIGAVGGFTYMEPVSAKATSFAVKRRSKSFRRVTSPGVHQVDYIMAIKLMKPEAYNVHYAFNKFGEDIGWCDAAAENGVVLYCDGRIAAKHVMDREGLTRLDKRVGY